MYITYISIITYTYHSTILFTIFNNFFIFFYFLFSLVHLSTNCNVSVESVGWWSDMLRNSRLFLSSSILADCQSFTCIATHYDYEICLFFYFFSTILSFFYVLTHFYIFTKQRATHCLRVLIFLNNVAFTQLSKRSVCLSSLTGTSRI